MLVISRWIRPRSVDIADFANHYSLLYTLEAVFGVSNTIGYATDAAASASTPIFGNLFNNYTAPSG